MRLRAAEDDLVPAESGAVAQLARAQETELPREISIAFTDGGSDYRRSAVTSRRLAGASLRSSRADLAVVTSDAAAERRAEIWLQDLWAGRETVEFSLPPSRLALMPGDLFGLTLDGRRRLWEAGEVVDTESRRVKARAIDPNVFDLPLGTPRRRAPNLPVPAAPAHAVLLDLPTLRNEEPPALTRAAVFAKPWPGAVAVWRSVDGASFERIVLAAVPAIVGETLDDLPRGPTSRWDAAARFRVRLYGGALAAASDLAVLAGANAAAVRRADGAWEVLQFAQAELVAERTYALSRLLRGQAGSEWAMGDPLPVGSAFVVLDAHLVTVAQGLDALGRPLLLRFVAASRDYADASAVEIAVTPSGEALQPLSPVHLRASRVDDGVRVTWIRRTRRDGDAWEAAEVALGEEREAYEIDILSGADVVRTLTAATPEVLYPAASEIADFGSAQAELSVRVFQLSATVGRGHVAARTFHDLT